MWIESRKGLEKTIGLCFLGTFGPEHAAFRAAEQFWVAFMVRLVRFAAGPKWSPAQVNVRAASVPRSAMRDLVGEATLRTRKNVTSIVFPSQPYAGPSETFPEKGSAVWTRHHRALRRGDTTPDLAGSLRLVLKSYLPDGSPTVQQAAKLTGMSVRTLQRRLKTEGVSYSQLLEELRHDLALYLLRNPESQASQVSSELGYRDPAIFTRSFRRWTGQTPSQYRRELWSRE